MLGISLDKTGIYLKCFWRSKGSRSVIRVEDAMMDLCLNNQCHQFWEIQLTD
jgi:hypothetical protein